MKLSVMITTYNLEKYIKETLESVINQQTDFDFEILVGDDGSSDGTICIVKEFVDKYPDKIKCFIMDRDPQIKYNRIERASKNRLNLITKATGEYLIFLDGDDTYTDSCKLQKQVNLLELSENHDCIACAHNTRVYFNDEKNYLINCMTKTKKISGRDYWKYGAYFHSDSLMFRNVFNGKIPENLPGNYYDDNIIVYYLLKYGEIIYIPDVMVNYRQVENSSWNSVDDVEKNIINLMDYDIEKNIYSEYQKESNYRHMYQFFYFWRNSKKVTNELQQKYNNIIEKDKLMTTKKWLQFHNLFFAERCKLSLWLLVNLTRYLGLKITKTVRGYKFN